MISKCIPKSGYAAEVKIPCCGSLSKLMVELVGRTCSCVGCSKRDVSVNVHYVCWVLEAFYQKYGVVEFKP